MDKKTILEAIPLPAIILNTNHSIIGANRSFKNEILADNYDSKQNLTLTKLFYHDVLDLDKLKLRVVQKKYPNGIFVNENSLKKNRYVLHFSELLNDQSVVAVFEKRCSEDNSPKNDLLDKYRWRNFVEFMPEGFQISEIETLKIIYANPAAARIYGINDPSKITGISVNSLIEFKNYEELKNRSSLLSMGIKPETTIHNIIGLDGIERFVEVDTIIIKIQKKTYLQTILRDKTKEIKVREKNLKSTKEREVLLAEVHHRVKNNLAILSGLLSIFEMESDNPELNRALESVQYRIQAMSSIHEIIYKTGDFSTLNLIDCLNQLVSYFKKSFEKTFYRFNVRYEQDIFLNINQSMNLLLLITEFMIHFTSNEIPISNLNGIPNTSSNEFHKGFSNGKLNGTLNGVQNGTSNGTHKGTSNGIPNKTSSIDIILDKYQDIINVAIEFPENADLTPKGIHKTMVQLFTQQLGKSTRIKHVNDHVILISFKLNENIKGSTTSLNIEALI